MAEFPKFDWNTVAAGMQVVPDDVIRIALSNSAGTDTLYSTWETMWRQGFAAVGIPTDDLALQGKMVREVMLGFYRAEALRRGLL